jgi:exodeoxyribonuclease III
MLKIISWNIQQGGGSRTLLISNALVNGNFDIIVLSEFKNNENGRKIQEILAKSGFHYQINTKAFSDENSVIIASKHKGEGQLYENADPIFTNNIATAKFSAFNLMGVYLPHKKKHNLLHFITNEISKSDVPFIVVGDYNIGHNFIDQKGDSFWYQAELQAFEKTGMVDTFRLKNGKAEEYSWFSHQGNGFRYDHTYVHESLTPIVKNCYYLHEWRQNKLSDHSPMVLELG